MPLIDVKNIKKSYLVGDMNLNILKGIQQPFDNEIRPIPTAVRYFIRARP